MTYWVQGVHKDKKVLYGITNNELSVHFGFEYLYQPTPDNFVPNQYLADWGYTCVTISKLYEDEQHRADNEYIKDIIKFWILENTQWKEITKEQFRKLGYRLYCEEA